MASQRALKYSSAAAANRPSSPAPNSDLRRDTRLESSPPISSLKDLRSCKIVSSVTAVLSWAARTSPVPALRESDASNCALWLAQDCASLSRSAMSAFCLRARAASLAKAFLFNASTSSLHAPSDRRSTAAIRCSISSARASTIERHSSSTAPRAAAASSPWPWPWPSPSPSPWTSPSPPVPKPDSSATCPQPQASGAFSSPPRGPTGEAP
mmetsp:Transcript_32903/g.74290  ORF Transcript_32903/g.74290 Transcript_32903/m.74290 type:complete len:211 (+) Transcript_32903:1048-1680(+)